MDLILSRPNRTIALLLSVAVLSFVFWNYPVFGNNTFSSDSGFYDRVAVNFMQGNGFTDAGEYQSYTIGYETFLVTVYTLLGHSANAVRGAQALLFLGIILLVFYFGRIFFGERSGFWAALFSALFYILPLSAGVIGKENLTTFLILIFLYFFLKWRERRRLTQAIFTGFFLGALALTAGIAKFLFIPFFIILVIVEWPRFTNKKLIASVILIFVAYAITVLPYFWLSMQKQSSLGLTDQGGGLSARAEIMDNLWDDYPAHLIGMSFGYFFSEKLYPEVSPTAFRLVPKTEELIQQYKEAGLPEYKWQDILFKKGLTEIIYNPHKYLLVSLLDFVSFNSPMVPHGEYRDMTFIHLTFAEGRYPQISPWLKSGYLLLVRSLWYAFFALVLYGMVLLWQRDRLICIFLLLLVLYFNGVYSLIHAIPRYAIPLYPLYIVFAAGGGVSFLSKIYEKFGHHHSDLQ